MLPEGSRRVRQPTIGKSRATDQQPSAVGWIELTVHVPAGLERRGCFLRHGDLYTVAWVSSGACSACLDREHPKVAQFNPITPLQCGCDIAMPLTPSLQLLPPDFAATFADGFRD
jgi:hypothetical protein